MPLPLDTIAPLLDDIGQALQRYKHTHTQARTHYTQTQQWTVRTSRNPHATGLEGRFLWAGTPSSAPSAHSRMRAAQDEALIWAMMARLGDLIATIPLLDHPHQIVEVLASQRRNAKVAFSMKIDGFDIHPTPVQMPGLLARLSERLDRLAPIAAPGAFQPFSIDTQKVWAPTPGLAMAKWWLMGPHAAMTATERNRLLRPDVSLILDQDAVRAESEAIMAGSAGHTTV